MTKEALAKEFEQIKGPLKSFILRITAHMADTEDIVQDTYVRAMEKLAKEGTVEAWGRSPKNPVGGWYGLKKGLRGRFGMYVPPLTEALGLAEVTHEARGNKMRAK